MDPRPRLQQALILGFEGDFDASHAALRQLEIDYPRDLDVKYELAMTQLMLGMFAEGCAKVREILAIDPTHERARAQASFCREDP